MYGVVCGVHQKGRERERERMSNTEGEASG